MHRMLYCAAMAEQVLLVEDSRAMRDYVSSILEAAGDFEVHEVDNGFEALRALPRGQYELIVTDVNMPDVSGIELCRFVRQSASHQDVPIIVISTDTSSVDTQRAMKAGASAFLAKPFTAEQFLEVLARARASTQARGASGGRGQGNA
jgi:two-component system, chemotaxis family, chemotaxis protein CheY